MSWSPDLYIGELRPWPDSVHVVRGNSGEAKRYTPERKDGQEVLERRIDELCAEVERGKAEFKKMDVWHSQELKAAMDENAKLRKMNEAMWLIIRCAIGEVSARDGLPVIHEDDIIMLRNMRRDLRNEVDE